MSAADSAWLRMEDPTNLMTVTAVMMLERAIDLDRLHELIVDRVLVHDRFRQRVRERPGRLGKPVWCPHEAFRLEEHVHRAQLPEPADESALQDFVGDVMSTPLDYDKPLWHVYYVDNFAGGAAIVARLHHAMGDGIALVRLFLSLTSTDPDRPAAGDFPTPRGGLPDRRGIAGVVGAAAGMVGTLGKLAGVVLLGDRRTALKGPLGTAKRAIWSRRIPLDEVKRVGRALGGTVNDVLLGAVSGGLRQYLERRHGINHGLSLRAVLPVNVRRADEPMTLGNKFGLVFLPLPVGIPERHRRLSELRRRMTRIKQSGEALVVFGILQLLGATAAVLEMAVVNLLGRNSTAVVTNVPGPRTPLYLCGSLVGDLVFWVPQSGRLALGVSILSYAGGVRIGVAADRKVIPAPEELVASFEQAFDELVTDAATSRSNPS
jgi:WS/DGAT/MGAT family acyltransferase